MQKIKLVAFCLQMAFFSLPGLATPTISDLKVTSVEPLGVVIDFSVSGATADDETTPFAVSMTANDVTYYAKNLSGATNCVNGAHRVYWDMAKDGLSVDPTTASLVVKYEYPLYCVIDLSGGSSADAYPVKYMSAPPSGGFNSTEYKTSQLVLKRVDAGSFVMGEDPSDESQRVTLTQAFYMGLYEVSQRQWELVTGSNPCSSTPYGEGDAYPVHWVSYDDIRGTSVGAEWPASNAVDSSSFLGKMRTRTGLGLDLPTEAQWEYTCRADTTTTYSYGDSADGTYMWYSTNSSGASHEVGTKLPNPWGFYNMHGNVWEWCLDWYGSFAYGANPKGVSSGSDRVLRGGCWNYDASDCTSSDQSRRSSLSSNRHGNGGFRLSRTLPAESSEAAMVEFELGRITQDDGVVIVDSSVPFVIPTSWFEKYPALGGTTVAEWQKIAEGSGLKTDASGAVLPVWHDYVAGTDPTDAASRLTTSIVFEDGKPVVSWSPALNGEGVREGVRTYRVWGKANLADAAWSEVAPDGESGYRFFRVTVEMP